MKTYTNKALNTAEANGASYADIRIIDITKENLMVRNGEIGKLQQTSSLGFGVRVIVDGAWGFAASGTVSKEEIEQVSKQACKIGKASASLQHRTAHLVDEPAVEDKWMSDYLIDPFQVPLDQKLDLLFKIDEILREKEKIKVAEASMGFKREHQFFASTEGSFIEQTITQSGTGYEATAVGNGEVQKRSYPTSFGRQYKQVGYELIESLDLLENADRVRDEAIALLTAKQCPEGEKDLILEGSQLALQIHESCGHPSELDRVMGMEANYAGTSFITTDKLRSFQYGSPIVDIVADGTQPGGLATVGYDDDGVRSQRWYLVKNGITWGYLTNRELADQIDEKRSRGCNRADGWRNLPMIRMTNISLLPGQQELDDIISDTKDGILMETNKSWSIDQKRLNFQFGCEIGWLIKDGKKTEMVKNPTYQGITPEFWGSCDAIANEKYWNLWGVANCGKGQPSQRAQMSHGAAPSRFKNVKVGIAD